MMDTCTKTSNNLLNGPRKINSYGKKYSAEGFRAGVLYRKQVWYDASEVFL